MGRVALFGGSFDPPHVGHQMVMLYALATARVERLLMVPCFRHPFDKRLQPFDHRLAMCELAAQPFGAQVEVSAIERELGGDSRTLRTVQALYERGVGERLVLVIGADLLAERERWFGYPELARLVDFFPVGRAGHPAPPPSVALPDVSSTEIRARLGRGEAVTGLVPSAVEDYVAAEGLYRQPS